MDVYKRIGVFVFYDPEGLVDDYVLALLNSVKEILFKLFVLVNGNIKDIDYLKLKKCADIIYIRENYGYDAGAYKDILTKYVPEEEWENSDEIILFNDTFFGPIYPWKQVFDVMEKEKADFWGLSRHPGGERPLMDGQEMPPHVQGYFLVCGKSMFMSSHWKKFWTVLEYPRTYQEAVENFEIRFSRYFEEEGYQSGAFTDHSLTKAAYGRNPCIYCVPHLVKESDFPILKIKAFRLEHLHELKEVMEHIDRYSNYDTDLIISHLKRLYREGRIQPIAPFQAMELERFYKEHRRIFLYGHGAYAKGLAAYFEYIGWVFEGFIVTENEENDSDTLVYGRMEFGEEDGVILALGKKAFCEVYPMVKKKLADSQLHCPEYDGQ